MRYKKKFKDAFTEGNHSTPIFSFLTLWKTEQKSNVKGRYFLSVSQGLLILLLLTHRWFNHPVLEPGSPQYLALQERRQLQCGLQPGRQQGPASPRHRNHTEDPPPRRPPHLQGSRKESHIEMGRN